MTVVDLKDYRAQLPKDAPKQPRRICFYSALHATADGQNRVFKICVDVADGDVLGILDAVKDQGLIAEKCSDGRYRVIPWPCAVVEIEDL